MTERIGRSGDPRRARVFPWTWWTEVGRRLFCQQSCFLGFREGLSVMQDNEDKEKQRGEKGAPSSRCSPRGLVTVFSLFLRAVPWSSKLVGQSTVRRDTRGLMLSRSLCLSGPVRTQPEGSCLGVRKCQHQPYWHLDLGLVASRTVRKDTSNVEILRLGYVVTAAWADSDSLYIWPSESRTHPSPLQRVDSY